MTMVDDLPGEAPVVHEHEHEHQPPRLWEPSTVHILALVNLVGGALVAFAITWANPLITVTDAGIKMKVFNWYLFVLSYASPYLAGMILIGIGQAIRFWREYCLMNTRRR